MAVIIENEVDNNIEALWQRVVKEPVDCDVDVIVLRVNHPECGLNKNSWDIKMMGKSTKDWVELAFDKCKIIELNYGDNGDILEFIRPYLGHKNYTAVFFSDTPLLQRKTFLSIIDFVKTKGLNACKLERGYVFNTEFALNAQRIFASTTTGQWDASDFMVANNMEKVYAITNILRNRIINFYERRGVRFIDKQSVFIDADVSIGENVIIGPNNVLEGNCEIMDGVELGVGNHIIDSKVGLNAKLMHSVVRNSEIKNNSLIEPFSFIDKGVVKK